MEKRILRHEKTGIKGEFVKEHYPTGKPFTTIIKLENGTKFFAPSGEFVKVCKKGGVRVGAGAPVQNPDGKPKIHCGYRLRPSVVEILNKTDNPTLYIENAILEKFNRDNK
jgi:hypothetical protein